MSSKPYSTLSATVDEGQGACARMTKLPAAGKGRKMVDSFILSPGRMVPARSL